MNSLTIIAGKAEDYPIATFLWGGNTAAVYGADDSLGAGVYLPSASTPLFSPDVAWYTAAGGQDGYGQGQVLVSITAAQSALLQRTTQYRLVVTWAPVAFPDKVAPIARLRLEVVSLASF